METHLTSSFVHVGRRRFWSEVCGNEEHSTPYQGIKEGFCNIGGLGRKFLLWNNIEVGLRKTNFGFLYAGVHQEGTPKIQT